MSPVWLETSNIVMLMFPRIVECDLTESHSGWCEPDREITQPCLSGGKQEAMSLVIYCAGISHVWLQTAHYGAGCHPAGQKDGQEHFSNGPSSALSASALFCRLPCWFNLWHLEYEVPNTILHIPSFCSPTEGEENAISSTQLSLVCLQGGFRAVMERWPWAEIGRRGLSSICTQLRWDLGCCVVTVCLTRVILQQLDDDTLAKSGPYAPRVAY